MFMFYYECMDSDIEAIKSQINLVDVVGDYVCLERAGAGQWKGLCPFHKEKSPSFTVSEERQLWHCFGCGKGGDLFSFVMEQEGVDFRDALVMLAERAGITLTKRRSSDGSAVTADRRKVLFEILDIATRFYQKQLVDGIGTRTARPYLVERGINEISMATFRLGFAPEGWRHILTFLLQRKYALADIAATGLIIQKDGTNGASPNDYYDRFRNRVMFPIMDLMGRVVGFSARILPSTMDAQENAKVAKYINTSESPVYHKSSVLYGIAQAKQAMKDHKRAVIMEGNMDVIAAHQAGIKEAVAVSGTALTVEHARIVRRYAPEVVLFFDNDAAGHAAAIKSMQICVAVGLHVKIVVIADGEVMKDPAEIAADNPARLKQMVDDARSAMEVFFARTLAAHDITQPKGRASVITTMAPLIAAHESQVEREYWSEKLAQRTQTSLSAIAQQLAQAQESSAAAPVTDVSDVQTAPSASEMRSDFLTETLLSLVAQSDVAFDTLMQQDFPVTLLAQKKGLHACMIAGAAGAQSFADVLDATTDSATVRLLERILTKHNNDATITAMASHKSNDDIVQEVVQRSAQIIAAWRKEERTRLIAALGNAEARGDHVQQQEILAQIQSLINEGMH